MASTNKAATCSIGKRRDFREDEYVMTPIRVR
jgi:hypothetical protein